MSELNSLSIQDLAHRFLNATIDQWGVNQQKVEEVLSEVRHRGKQDEFADTLWSFRLNKRTGEIYTRLLRKYGDALVPSILKDEMSGAALSTALGIWKNQPQSQPLSEKRGIYFLIKAESCGSSLNDTERDRLIAEGRGQRPL